MTKETINLQKHEYNLHVRNPGHVGGQDQPLERHQLCISDPVKWKIFK